MSQRLPTKSEDARWGWGEHVQPVRFTFIAPNQIQARYDGNLLDNDIVDRSKPRDVKAFAARVAKAMPAELGGLRQLTALVEADLAEAMERPNESTIHYPVARYMSDVEPKEIEWIWPNRIPLGMYTLLCSDPGLGKTYLACDLMSRVSNGTKWPDSADRAPIGGSIFLTAEDDLDYTIRPRLDAAGADVSKIVTLDAVGSKDANGEYKRAFDLNRDLDVIEQVIDTMLPDCKLVVIDPISAYMGKIDSHKNADVRSVLGPVQELASRRRIAVLGITHLRKGEGAAIYRAMGSLAFIAAARAGWCLTKDSDDESGKRRLLLPIKCNLSPDNNGLAFQLTARHTGTQPCVEWEAGTISTTADEALSPDTKRRGPEPEAADEAESYLRDALGDGNGHPARELIEEAREVHSIAKRTLERAKQTMGVEAYREKVPGPWLWRLPKAANPDGSAPQHKLLGVLGDVAKPSGYFNEFEAFEPQQRQGRQVGDVGSNGDTEGGWEPDELANLNAMLADAGEDAA